MGDKYIMRQTIKKVFFVTSLVLFFYQLRGQNKVLAQDFSLSLSPPLIQVTAKPGTSLTQAYELVNTSTQTLYLVATIEPFIPGDMNGYPNYQLPAPAPHPQPVFSLTNADIQLGDTFAVPPNSTKQLVVKITFPNDLPQEDYYYTLFVAKALEQSFGQSSVNPKIGSHLLLSASFTYPTSTTLTAKSLKVQGGLLGLPLFDLFFDPVQATLKLANTDPHLATASGTLSLVRNSHVRQLLPIRPDYVLANSARLAHCQDPKGLGNCTFSPPFWPGIYELTYTSDHQTSTKRLLMLPYVTALPLILVWLILFLLKHYKQTNN